MKPPKFLNNEHKQHWKEFKKHYKVNDTVNDTDDE